MRNGLGKLESIGEVIATRTLNLRLNDGGTSEVVVLLGKPQRLPEHGQTRCLFQGGNHHGKVRLRF